MVATIAVLGTFFCCPVASVAKPTKSANSTDIDEAWLTARPAPYLLDRPNETYVLQTDVTVDETAFVISEPGITLDLNGHTITYNNAAPIEVPNGNFSADRTGATSITDWDTSGAATSKLTISPNDCYLHSDKVLKWSVESGNTPRVIKSGKITIPKAHRTYTACAALSGVGTTGWNTVKLEVFDAVTHKLVAPWQRGESGNDSHGHCPQFNFIPATTNPVYIQITLTPSKTPTSIKLNRVILTRTCDAAILATRDGAWGSAWSLWWNEASGAMMTVFDNMPKHIKDISNVWQFTTKVNAPTIKDSLWKKRPAGSYGIVQGRQGGSACHAVVLRATNGPVVLDGISTYTWGDDLVPINANLGNDPTTTMTVRNCTLSYPGTAPTTPPKGMGTPRRRPINYRRDEVRGAMAVAGGVTVVENCTVTNYPQGGIFAGGRAPAGKYDVVQNCTLHGNVAITNGFALNAGARIKLLHNTITGSTRGIAVMDGGNTDCEIAGNSVIVREYPNREYGNTGTTVRAFEMRSYKVLGTLTDINIHDNHFEAISDETTFHGASGVRIVQVIEGSKNIRFTNNFIKATVARTVPDDEFNWAHAMDINTSRSDDDLTVAGNTFESNNIGVGLGGYGSVGEADPFKNILFLHNTFKKSSDGVQDRKFYPYEMGFYNQPYTNVKLIGSSFPDNVTDSIHWLGGGAIDNISTGWPVAVKVTAGPAKCPDAVVELYDRNGMLLTKRSADDQGMLRDLLVPVKRYARPLHGALSTTDLTPLTLRILWDGREKKQQIAPDKDATIDIALGPDH
jgi:hypothetical protein